MLDQNVDAEVIEEMLGVAFGVVIVTVFVQVY